LFAVIVPGAALSKVMTLLPVVSPYKVSASLGAATANGTAAVIAAVNRPRRRRVLLKGSSYSSGRRM
jgi:hypothetical protein